ncbi:MAG: Rap1a/Tai family immunity protein [Pseudomonadota bacterium]
MKQTTAWWNGLLAAVIATCFTASPVTSQEPSYTVAELLTSCREGLNASREVEQAAETACQQYLAGFRDALVSQGLANGASGLCFPHGMDHRAEMQRAFVEWAVHETHAQGWAAADGVLAAMHCEK